MKLPKSLIAPPIIGANSLIAPPIIALPERLFVYSRLFIDSSAPEVITFRRARPGRESQLTS